MWLSNVTHNGSDRPTVIPRVRALPVDSRSPMLGVFAQCLYRSGSLTFSRIGRRVTCCVIIVNGNAPTWSGILHRRIMYLRCPPQGPRDSGYGSVRIFVAPHPGHQRVRPLGMFVVCGSNPTDSVRYRKRAVMIIKSITEHAHSRES